MDDEKVEEINIPKLIQAQNKRKSKGGFQVLGLSRPVLNGILHKGYKLPTPIQRKAVPIILEGKDVVAMARTGSGKTAAFLIPLFEKLKVHAAKVGARALILSPTRELALQTLSFAKELGKYTGLRAAAILGGENMEIQFAALHENPDVIIATPGRFTHVCVEMNLKLDTVEYVVFDEADRLFEMGFQEQLNDILKRLSTNRQTVLFSATLPKMLVEFARAGLSDPTLIRLDAETKLSENLKLGFFKLNSEDKLPFLLYVLEKVISKDEQTVVFVPTKHHVEYIYKLLTTQGLSATYVYSSLDASARKINIAKFRAKRANLLIVTDIAARGLDIPLLDNAINFNFPPKAKLFIHRVGRVARAGRAGTAYSFVSPDELPYLLELHMFLSRSVKLCPVLSESNTSSISNNEDWDRMLGSVPREIINENEDFIRRQLEFSYDLEVLRKGAENGLLKYRKTCPAASRESSRRLKEELWGLQVGFHPLFKEYTESPVQQKRFEMLEKLKNVRPKLTVFEVRSKNDKKKDSSSSCFMQEKRKLDGEKIESFHKKMVLRKEKADEMMRRQKEAQEMDAHVDEPSELEVVNAFSTIIGKNAKNKSSGANSTPLGVSRNDMTQDFIPYKPADYDEEQGYSVMSNFEKETSRATLDLIGDDERTAKLSQPRMKWDRKLKKYKGQDQEKKIKTESGAWVSASYKKDLYQKWKMKMHPQQQEEEVEDGGDEGEWRRDKLDWRGKGKKNFGTKKEKGFVSLTETGIRNRAHPLVKDRKVGNMDYKALRKATGDAQQVRSYEQKMKDIKLRNKKKFKFSKKKNSSKKRKKNKM